MLLKVMGYRSHERTYLLNICTHVTTLEAVLFPTKYRVLAAMSTKWFDIQSAICRVWRRAIVNNNYDTWSFSEKQTFSQKTERHSTEKPSHTLKMLWMVYLCCCCCSSLLVVCGSVIWLENLWTLTCVYDCSFEIVHCLSLCKFVSFISTHPLCFAAVAKCMQPLWVGRSESLTLPISVSCNLKVQRFGC